MRFWVELEYRRIVERHYVEAENGERTEGEIFGGGGGNTMAWCEETP